MNPQEHAYWYKFQTLRVIDGDTIYGSIDLGFRHFWYITMRFYGINTPELHSFNEADRARANAAKDFVSSKLNNKDAEVWINTHKDKGDKYGRWLCDVYYTLDSGQTWNDLNEELVLNNLAVRL